MMRSESKEKVSGENTSPQLLNGHYISLIVHDRNGTQNEICHKNNVSESGKVPNWSPKTQCSCTVGPAVRGFSLFLWGTHRNGKLHGQALVSRQTPAIPDCLVGRHPSLPTSLLSGYMHGTWLPGNLALGSWGLSGWASMASPVGIQLASGWGPMGLGIKE